MAADTPAKRYSAMNLGSPWRGLNVDPDVTIPAGERAAAMYLYYLVAAAPGVGTGDLQRQFVGEIQDIGISAGVSVILDASIGPT